MTQTAPEQKPLPCPFCGETPTLDAGINFPLVVHPQVAGCPERGMLVPLEEWNRRRSSPGGEPLDYVKVSKAIHSIYRLTHSEVLRMWEGSGRKADGETSIQQMRVELARDAMASGERTPPDDAMHPEYGITWGDLRERIASIERGEGIPHEEATRRLSSPSVVSEAPATPDAAYRQAWHDANQSNVDDSQGPTRQFVGNAQTRHHTWCAFRADASQTCTCSIGSASAAPEDEGARDTKPVPDLMAALKASLANPAAPTPPEGR